LGATFDLEMVETAEEIVSKTIHESNLKVDVNPAIQKRNFPPIPLNPDRLKVIDLTLLEEAMLKAIADTDKTDPIRPKDKSHIIYITSKKIN